MFSLMEGNPSKVGLQAPALGGAQEQVSCGQLRPSGPLAAIWSHLVLQPLPGRPI